MKTPTMTHGTAGGRQAESGTVPPAANPVNTVNTAGLGSQDTPEPGDGSELRDKLHRLHQATLRIGASQDLTEIATGLAEALVPCLAEHATVHLLEALFDDHRLRARPPGHTGTSPFPSALRRVASAGHPPTPDEATTAASTADVAVTAPATGEPVAGPHHDIRSGTLLTMPLAIQDRVLGALVLGRAPGRDSYGEVETLMVRQLAVQTALSIDNAHRYRTEAVIADALQRSMLPTRLPEPAGVQIAHRYLPAGHSAQVGGDWFDVIPLPGSRVALVVGDVMGHGIDSAATMGRYRTAVRTLATLDLPPDQVLRHLDDLAGELDDSCLATCVYVVYDPVARRCAIANAGHIPPVLVTACGRTELLTVPTGAPIGVGGVAFETVEVPADDGAVLVLCTDGLVEARGRDIKTGLTELCATLATPDLPLQARCDRLLRDLRTSERQDDVAVLMARFQGIPSDSVAQWLLQPRTSTPARVRRLVRSTLTGWGLADCCDVAELLAGELVTNAVRHATRPIGVRLLRTDALLCEVTDNDHHLPVLRDASDDAEGGRGLQLVSRLARRWGVSRTGGGKVVWFEQPFTGDTGCAGETTRG